MLSLFHGGALQEVGVCVCVLVWSGGKEEGKQRMLNKIINSCHWRERRVEERERGKSQLWEPAVREEQEERRKVDSLRVLGKLWEVLEMCLKQPAEI